MTLPAAIVLAAGAGRRMGGPKALLMLDGESLVSAHVLRLRSVGCAPILVVVRETESAEVRALLRDVPEARVVAADTDSMAASLAVALDCLSPEASRAVVITPVDAVPALPSTVDALVAAVESGVDVATPRYQGRGGHPVAVRDSLLQAFRDGYAGTLRDLIRSVAARQRMEFDDPAIGTDLDSAADVTALRPGQGPRFAAAVSSSPQALANGDE